MSEYTKGPWRIGSKFEIGPRSDADDQSFGMIEPLADVYGDNRDADARLIAAAPKLIDALQMLIDYADDSDGCQYGTLSTDLVRNIAQQAIDLATK